MRTKIKRLLVFVLCLALCMDNILTVGAAGESNMSGVTFTAELDTDTIQVSDIDQTIVMRIKASEGVTVDGIGFTVTKDDALAIAGITGGDTLGAYDSGATNIATGKAAWGSADSENVTGVTELAVITFTIPANTVAGSYTVGIKDLELTKDYGTIWENAASATATLTVTPATTTEGYTAGISADTVTVEEGAEVSIKVSAGHATQQTFNADEIEISYDQNKLAFNKAASTLNGTEVTDDSTDGKLKLANHGADRNFGDIYTLVFDTIATGSATVTLNSAGFIDKAGASQSDLLTASINPGTVNLTINEAQFSVTLPAELAGVIEGATTVVAGSSYEFKVLNINYTYEFSATMDGEPVAVTSTDGVNFTVDQVTDDLIIELVSRTEKSYTVTISGDGAGDVKAEDGTSAASITATYNTDYVFEVNGTAGYGYPVTMTINGESYSGWEASSEGLVTTYTIPGGAITGDISITVGKVAGSVNVIVEGDGAGMAAGYETTAVMNQPYTLTVTPENGYDHDVTATMGGETITPEESDDKTTYTIQNVTGDIVFTITRKVNTEGVAVHNKVSIDGENVYAVTYPDKNLADNKVPTYNGSPMYWSENHQAYIYLTIAGTLSEDAVKAIIGIADGAKITVPDSSDINGSGKLDASDAQYVWNMYKAQYSEFTEDVTMIDFIKADRNADYKIDTTDAAAVVNEILGITTQ